MWKQCLEFLTEVNWVWKTEINGRGGPLRWPRDTLYPQKLAVTSPTSDGRSVGIVRLRTKATEFSLVNCKLEQFEFRRFEMRGIHCESAVSL
jgi:hypothetical protein